MGQIFFFNFQGVIPKISEISEGLLPVDENFRGVKKIAEISEGLLPVDENFRGGQENCR